VRLTRCIIVVQEGDILISVNGQSVVALDFRDVRRLLKVSSRPIRLRFRSACPQYTGSENDDGRSDVAFSDIATASGSVSSESSSDVDNSGPGDASDLSAFALPAPSSGRDNGEVNEHDDDDVESRQAVQSESFGDADSTRTTENSSVLADLSDFDYKFARHSLFSTFLRKPFRRMDGVDNRWIDTRLGAVPVLPRVEVALESPSKVRKYGNDMVPHRVLLLTSLLHLGCTSSPLGSVSNVHLQSRAVRSRSSDESVAQLARTSEALPWKRP
jgi:hypothetical protein